MALDGVTLRPMTVSVSHVGARRDPQRFEVEAGGAGSGAPREVRHRLARYFEDERAVQDTLERGLRGEPLSGLDMLQMQAAVYAYSQRVEFVTRIVDRLSSGVKQLVTLQG